MDPDVISIFRIVALYKIPILITCNGYTTAEPFIIQLI